MLPWIIAAAGTVGGAALSARGQSQANQQALARQQAQNAQVGSQNAVSNQEAILAALRGTNQDTAQTYANELSQQQAQAAAGLAATAPGGNPFATNTRRVQNAVLRALTEGSAGGSWQAGGPIPGVESIGSVPQFSMDYGPYANQYLQPDVLADAESVFGQNLAQVAPDAAQPNLSTIYGSALGDPANSQISATQQRVRTNQQQLRTSEREALMRGIANAIAGLQQTGQTAYNQSQQPIAGANSNSGGGGNSALIASLLGAAGGAAGAYGLNRYVGSQPSTAQNSVNSVANQIAGYGYGR